MLEEECIQYQLWPWLLTLMFVFGTSSNANEAGLCVGEITVGEMTPLERAIKESRTNYKKVVLAQALVDGVKVDGIDTNLAVMKGYAYGMRSFQISNSEICFLDEKVVQVGWCCDSALRKWHLEFIILVTVLDEV
ncbi:hypothetical protein ACSBR1_002109 [Camellia fascicularis]